MKRILAWLEARLSLRDTVGPMLMHPIPRVPRRSDGVVVRLWQRVHDPARDPRTSRESVWCWSTCRVRTMPTRAWST